MKACLKFNREANKTTEIFSSLNKYPMVSTLTSIH